ncbi:MAG: hypothetical protein OXE77_09480 [Flavobacteriaceae bacterium]|nr:hypothetical protein [Flavobacteriaceae bacterium]MCY4267748.1 hypothetical protein [Flavobacteriaceae bacterium]
MRRVESQIVATNVKIGDLIQIREYESRNVIIGNVEEIVISTDVYIRMDETIVQNSIRFLITEENSQEQEYSIFLRQDEFVTKMIICE